MAGFAAWGRTARSALVAGLAAASAWAAPALAQPALWAVKDADSTIYFLGTVHLLKPETEWRSEKLDAAIAESQALWLELPLDQPGEDGRGDARPGRQIWHVAPPAPVSRPDA
jgi:hypothetical protein